MKSLYGITARIRFWNISFQPTSKSELVQLFSFEQLQVNEESSVINNLRKILCLRQLLLNSATIIKNLFQPEDRSFKYLNLLIAQRLLR